MRYLRRNGRSRPSGRLDSRRPAVHPVAMQAKDHDSLGRRVAARRGELRLTQKEVAAEAGISVKTLQRVEDGEVTRTGTLARIDQVLQWETGSAEAVLRGGQPTPKAAKLEVVQGGKPDTQALAAMLKVLYDTEGFRSFRDEYSRMKTKYGEDIAREIRDRFAEITAQVSDAL